MGSKKTAYEYVRSTKAIASVTVVADEELQKSVAEDLKVADPENAKEIIDAEKENGRADAGVLGPDSEEAGAETKV